MIFLFRRLQRRKIKDLLSKINKNYEVLEIGCGERPHFENSTKIDSIFGHDVETGIIFKDNSFDYVIMEEVLEHLRKQNFVLSEIARVLKPKGLFVFSTPNRLIYRMFIFYEFFWNDNLWTREGGHIEERSFKELRDLFSHHFSKVKIGPCAVSPVLWGYCIK